MISIARTPKAAPTRSRTSATVDEVRPLLGLAYLAGEDGRERTVTRSTAGVRLAALEIGQQVQLVIEEHEGFAIVRECDGPAGNAPMR